MPMPWWAVREMVADWLGAGRAYEGQYPDVHNWTWYEKNRDKMRLDLVTESRVECVIEELKKEE